QPHVGLGDRLAHEVAAVGQPLLQPAQRGEQPVVGGVVRLLGAGEPAPVDAVVDLGVDAPHHLAHLLATRLGVEVRRALAVVVDPLAAHVEGDLREVVGDDGTAGNVDDRGHGDALRVAGDAAVVGLGEPVDAEHGVEPVGVEVERPRPHVVRRPAERDRDGVLEPEQPPHDDRAVRPRARACHDEPVAARLGGPAVGGDAGDAGLDVGGVPRVLLTGKDVAAACHAVRLRAQAPPTAPAVQGSRTARRERAARHLVDAAPVGPAAPVVPRPRPASDSAARRTAVPRRTASAQEDGAVSLPLIPAPARLDLLDGEPYEVPHDYWTAGAGPETGDVRYSLEVSAEGGFEIAPQGPGGDEAATATVVQLVELTQRRVPALRIEDAPRYAWRGLMIDVARHFFGPGTLRKVIDLAALYKLNVLHLHLTDDQGWRYEVPNRAELTEVSGATAVGGS